MFRVMQRTAKQSLYRLVTFIHKIVKVRLLGRAKMVQITNFCLIDVLFSGSPRR